LLITHQGRPLLSKGYGWANLELRVPATADTVWEIASITKLFTAQAIMLLVADGKLTLDSTLGAYLPDLPTAWQTARLDHLLTHRAGIPNYTDPPAYWQTTRLDISREAILDLVRDRPLDFAPGTRWRYSNTGYYLLGLLIEARSGQPYAEFLAQRIFVPLGMTATRANDPYAIVPGRAAGYTLVDGELRNAEYYSASGTYAAGVLLSTVADLARWDAALATGTVLDPALVAEMWTPRRPDLPAEPGAGFRMGWGWFVFDEWDGTPRRWAGHNGGIKGFSSTLTHFFEPALTVVLLFNRDGYDRPDSLARPIIREALAALETGL
jgi:CubicO group peptidase (beta-lactamase class C family)